MSVNIDDVTSADLVALDLSATDATGAIEELAALLESDGRVTDRSRFVEAALQREPTGMEMGVAIPHAKSAAVTTAGVAFGRTAAGIDFGADDGTPSDLVFLIAAPQEGGDLHVTVLSKLARRLVHEEFRTTLRQARTPEDAIEAIRGEVRL